MKYSGILVICLKLMVVNNKTIPPRQKPYAYALHDLAISPEEKEDEPPIPTVADWNDDIPEKADQDVSYLGPANEMKHFEDGALNEQITDKQKPCSVVILSNIQNPNVQSLLRKYRYDANGSLIPSSVKYFIKLPSPQNARTILVPLNDKAFTPLGGFVRYYKEVPPIPQSWK